MLFQLRTLILWPRNSAMPPRTVNFELGKLNIITGASKTGKSAIIPIIDYCLGAESCAIPVQTIRNACSWFGILLETDEGQKLFARREPGSQRITSDMYTAEGANVSIPVGAPVKNDTADNVRQRLDDLARLSRLPLDPTSSSGFKGRPSFRDLVAFVFQPQNVVANPNILFYKADSYEHREKLRAILPYVLGALTPEALAASQRLSSLQAELRVRQRELAISDAAVQTWLADLRARAARAAEFGLLDASASDANQDSLLAQLRALTASPRTRSRITQATVEGGIGELLALEKEEQASSETLFAVRRRLGDMLRLRDTGKAYQSSIRIKRDRLKLADWLSHLPQQTRTCPICASNDPGTGKQLSGLVQSLRDAEDRASISDNVAAAFDRELQRVHAEVEVATSVLDAIKVRKATLEGQSKAQASRAYMDSQVDRFLGGLEEAFNRFDKHAIDRDLHAAVQNLSSEIAELQTRTDPAGIKRATEYALARISRILGELVPQLDVERPSDPVELSPTELSIKVKSVDRDDYLWEIGSGANWVGYHVATLLALQRYFLDSNSSPVPGLLVFDQPSQVYFPRRLAADGDVDGGTDHDIDLPLQRDEDIEAVRKLFALISKVVDQSHGQLQAIVLDHAGEEVWLGIPNAVLVEEWRDGEKLVPQMWLN